MPLTRVYHAQKPSFWQRQHANLACCREPNLIFASLTAQRIFAIKTRRTKPPAAISQDYLLGGCAFGASGILFIAEATATRKPCVLPRAKLDFCFANRAENLRYQFKQGQKLLPQFRKIICLVKVGRDTRTRCITVAEDYSLFEAFLYTVCACSKTEHEPQGGEKSERRV